MRCFHQPTFPIQVHRKPYLFLNCCVRQREPTPVTSVSGADGNFSGSDTRLSQAHSADHKLILRSASLDCDRGHLRQGCSAELETENAQDCQNSDCTRTADREERIRFSKNLHDNHSNLVFLGSYSKSRLKRRAARLGFFPFRNFIPNNFAFLEI